jgi:serine/threonine-protein kinase
VGGELDEATGADDPDADEPDTNAPSSMPTMPAKKGAELKASSSPSSADAPTRRPAPSSSDEEETAAGSRGHSTTLTPELAMQADEVARTRLFLKVCAALSVILSGAAPFLSGPVWLRITVICCCVVAATTVLVFSRKLRGELMYSSSGWQVVSYVLMAAAATGVLLIGVYSPAPMVGTLGIYFLCLGSSLPVAITAWMTGGLLHLIPAVLIALGKIQDPGLFRPRDVTTRDLLIVELLVQVVYALTFVLARGSRRATRAAVDRLHQALAQVQKREALLAEAHLDLDRALRGGFAGRYTDRKLGPYLLGDVIGRGAMSEVYRAKHEGGAAAVKVLQRDLVVDPHQVKRFLREAEIVTALTSPHVVRVLSFGNFGSEPRFDGDEPPYIAMELLEGRDLAWHLRRERRLPAPRLLDLVDQVAHALAEAAEHEVVHRDLKPQNIFQRIDGDKRTWKVLDFGVSKLASAHGTLTQGAIVGTPGYMAPEQARGGEVGHRADVFALAVIAYRAITGRPAFAGKDMPRVLFDVCYVQPMRPGRLIELPEDVERVLALGMAKQAGERIESARAFADALRVAFEGKLDLAYRKRADELLAQFPWGYRPPA